MLPKKLLFAKTGETPLIKTPHFPISIPDVGVLFCLVSYIVCLKYLKSSPFFSSSQLLITLFKSFECR